MPATRNFAELRSSLLATQATSCSSSPSSISSSLSCSVTRCTGPKRPMEHLLSEASGRLSRVQCTLRSACENSHSNETLAGSSRTSLSSSGRISDTGRSARMKLHERNQRGGEHKDGQIENTCMACITRRTIEEWLGIFGSAASARAIHGTDTERVLSGRARLRVEELRQQDLEAHVEWCPFASDARHAALE